MIKLHFLIFNFNFPLSRANVYFRDCRDIAAWSFGCIFPTFPHGRHPLRVCGGRLDELGSLELVVFALPDPAHSHCVLHTRQPDLSRQASKYLQSIDFNRILRVV